MNELASSDLLASLKRSQKIKNTQLKQPLELHKIVPLDAVVNFPIEIEDSNLDYFDISFHTFLRPVSLRRCKLKYVMAMSCFFTAGFEMIDCIVQEGGNFVAGGHNRNGSIFTIQGSRFDGFVEFCDSWFEDTVVISGNTFNAGTDLLTDYDHIGCSTQFDKSPELEGNIGDLKAIPIKIDGKDAGKGIST